VAFLVTNSKYVVITLSYYYKNNNNSYTINKTDKTVRANILKHIINRKYNVNQKLLLFEG